MYSLTDLEVGSLNQSVGKTVLLLEGSGETLCPCLFWLLAATCAPWLMALSSVFREPLSNLCFLCPSPASAFDPSCFLLLGSLVMTPAHPYDPKSSPHLQMTNFITSVNSPLPGEIIYSQLSGVQTWTSLGAIIQPATVIWKTKRNCQLMWKVCQPPHHFDTEWPASHAVRVAF